MAELRLEPMLQEILHDVLEGNPQRALLKAREAAGAFDADRRAHYALASALMAAGETDAAAAALATAQNTHCLQMLLEGRTDVRRMQTDAAYAMSEGRRYYNQDLLGAASTACAFASRDPAVAAGVSGGLHVWGQALFHQGAGRIEQALRTFAAAFNAQPSPLLYSFVLYALFFVENGRNRHAAEARAWAKACADSFTPAAPAFLVARCSDRPLRVGYMAPSFTGNQLSPFALPLINGHDPARCEAFVYADDAAREAFDETVTVRSVKHLTHDLHARLIQSDRIDVLVDVWGHAAGGRLPVFARKPAPVQASWLNYIQTTGVAAMDYVIHSDFMDAPGREALFTEAIANVGPVLALFRPPPAAKPSPAPVLSRGYTTFASFNHPAKVSEKSLKAWAEILKAAPGSRLLFKYRYFVDPVVQDTLRARMLGYGADPMALDFEGFSKGDEYEGAFARVDLMLDTSPVNGGTTTMEALSRGVPVLTLDDRSDFYARMGVQPLMALGMPEMIADDWDGYIEKAVALAADPPALGALRARVRPALDASAYRDEAGFTARMENLYREMFEAWLARPEQAAA